MAGARHNSSGSRRVSSHTRVCIHRALEADMDTTSTDTYTPSSTLVTKGGRKRSEVEAAASAAGLAVSEGTGATQLLRFANQLNSQELRLMELPQEVLHALKCGER